MMKILLAVFVFVSVNTMAQESTLKEIDAVIIEKVALTKKGGPGNNTGTQVWNYATRSMNTGEIIKIHGSHFELVLGQVVQLENHFPSIYKVKCLNHTSK